jgi:glutathione S-transferase
LVLLEPELMFGRQQFQDPYPGLNAWIDLLSQRESFRQTAPTPEQVQAALPTIKKIMENR